MASSVEQNMRPVRLRSSDLVVFVVNTGLIRGSLTMLSKFAELKAESDSTEVVIDLPEVTSGILEKVIAWLKYHKDKKSNGNETDAEELNNELKTYDESFLQVDPGTLFEILLAADYLDIKGLLDIACNKVVSMIKGKTTDEIRESFKVRNDFTKEEEELVRKENEWCENK